jgi:hypothetical protein
MIHCRSHVAAAVLCILNSLYASAQSLWHEPQPAGIPAWTWGPGGRQAAPQPPLRFVTEKFEGTNPKSGGPRRRRKALDREEAVRTKTP